MKRTFMVDCVAGNGKTTQAVRICTSEKGSRILYVCFQKYDRQDVIQKLEAQGFELQNDPLRGISVLLHPETKTEIHVANVHALGAWVLRKEMETVVHPIDENRSFWQTYMQKYPRSYESFEEGGVDPRYVGDILFSLRNFMITKFGEVVPLGELQRDEDGEAILRSLRARGGNVSQRQMDEFLKDLGEAVKVYEKEENQRRKKKNRMTVTTYADMLEPLERYREEYDIVIVDEAQDQPPVGLQRLTSAVSWDRLYLFGDVNQRIFGFSGTVRDIFSYIHSILPKTVAVECVEGEEARRTWRVPQENIHLAHMHLLREKKHIPVRNGGTVGGLTEFLIATKFRGETGMVLVRNRILRKKVEAILRDAGVPSIYVERLRWLAEAREAFRRIEGGDYEERDVQKVARFLGTHAGADPQAEDVLRWMGVDPEELGRVGVDVDTIYTHLKKNPIERKVLTGEVEPVVISTIHRAKGKEADHVLLLQNCTKLTEFMAQLYPEHEIPVKYVAHTRHRIGHYIHNIESYPYYL